MYIILESEMFDKVGKNIKDKYATADLFKVFVFAGIIPFILSMILEWLFPVQIFTNNFLHSVVELFGASISFLLFLVFLISLLCDDSKGKLSSYLSLTSGFLILCLFDAVHGFIPPGNSFVWAHILAMFFGGGLFSIVWFKQNIQKIIIVFVVILIAAISAISMGAPGFLPSMLYESGFTQTAVFLSITAGLLFMLSAIYFINKHRTEPLLENSLLAYFFQLQATSSFLFTMSSIWQTTWWLWHFVRVVSFLLLLILLIYDIIKSKSSEFILRKALEKQKERFRFLMDTSNDAIHILDWNGNLIECNQVFLNHLGYSAEEARLLNVSDWDRQWGNNELMEVLRTLIKSGNTFETTHQKKDGSIREVEISANGFTFDGEVFLYAAARDITERKQVQKQFEEISYLNQRILNSSTLGIFACKESGPCVMANEALAQISGAPLETMLRLNFRKLETWKTNGLLDAVERVLETGVEEKMETHILSSFGRDVWIGYTISKFTMNEEPHFLMYVVDITNRKNIERLISLSEEKYRNLYESSIDGIYLTTLEGRILEFNDSYKQMLGYSKEDLSAMNYKQFVPEHLYRIEEDIFFTQVKKNGYSELYDSQLICKSGDTIEVQVRKWMGSSEGEKAIWTAVRNVTQQKLVEKQLKQTTANLVDLSEKLKKSNEELDDFAYIASHDLREPLRSISNYSDFLLEDYSDILDSEGKRMLNTLVRSSKRMGELIDALLRYARLGRVEFMPEQVDLDTIIEMIKEDMDLQLKENNSKIIIEKKLPTIRIDKVLIKEIFANLISNGIKYNEEPSKEILIGYKEENSSQPDVFYVRDNGIGIPEMHYKNIFKIFKRLHTRDKYGGGTGAGLTIVKKMVEALGGSIWVESEIGKGSTFYFTIGRNSK